MVKRKILLLDDDMNFRNIVLPILRDKGYEVLHSINPEEARVELGVSPVDLVIVDGMLPQMDGISFIRELRKAGIQTKIMFVSAHWRDAGTYKTLTEDLNVSQVLHKPIYPSVLAQHVHALFEEKANTEASPGTAKKLAALSARFARLMPAMIDEIKADLATAKMTNSENALAEVQAKLHRLKGTAGTYGFMEISQMAHGLQDSVTDVQSGMNDGAAAYKQIEQSLAQAYDVASGISQWDESEFEKLTTANSIPVIHSSRPAPKAASPAVKKRVLCFDDDEQFVKRIRVLLEAESVEVSSVNDAVNIVETVGKTRPDLVLLDADMPGISGFDACRLLRESSEWQNLPILFVTANVGWEARVAAYECGGDDYIPKPIVNAEVLHKAQVWLRRGR